MSDVLVLSPNLPSFSASGSHARLAEVLAHWKRRGDRVHLVVACRRANQLVPPDDLHQFADELTTIELLNRPVDDPSARLLNRFTRASRSWFLRAGYWLKNRISSPTSVVEEVGEVVRRTKPDVIWVSYAYMSPLLSDVPANSETLRIVDTIDVMHQREASLRSLNLKDSFGHNITRDEEAALLNQFDVVVAIQNAERAVLEEMLPERRVITVGRSISVSPQPSRANVVGYVGARSPVNAHGLIAFIEQAWPEIIRLCPDAKLSISGSISQDRVVKQCIAGAGIEVRGIVPELRDVYDGPAVMICPLWAGSGLKQKLVESLAFGKASVATPVAAQGLEDGIDDAFLLAEKPGDFVEPVVDLLQDELARMDLEQSAALYAESHFASSVIYRELDAILDGRRVHRLTA